MNVYKNFFLIHKGDLSVTKKNQNKIKVERKKTYILKLKKPGKTY